MFQLFDIKSVIYGLVIITILGTAYATLQSWHYTPIVEGLDRIKVLEKQLNTVGTALNTCEANLTKQSLDSFIEGLGADNEIFNNISLDNLHT